MREGTKAKIETEPRCSNCEKVLKYTSCIECQTFLVEYIGTGEAFGIGYKLRPIYCYGPKGENWHRCNKCFINLENLKCPKCGLGQERISRYAKDTNEGVMIVNTCRNNHSWETKRGE